MGICGAVAGQANDMVAPITPGVVKTKLELEAATAIAGMLPSSAQDFANNILFFLINS